MGAYEVDFNNCLKKYTGKDQKVNRQKIERKNERT